MIEQLTHPVNSPTKQTLQDTVDRLLLDRERLFQIIGLMDDQLSKVLECLKRNVAISVPDEQQQLMRVRQAVPGRTILQTTAIKKPIQIGLNIDSIHTKE